MYYKRKTLVKPLLLLIFALSETLRKFWLQECRERERERERDNEEKWYLWETFAPSYLFIVYAVNIQVFYVLRIQEWSTYVQ